MTRRRRILLAVAAVLAAILLLRAAGAIELDAYGSNHTLGQTVNVHRAEHARKGRAMRLRIVRGGDARPDVEVLHEHHHAGAGPELVATFELSTAIDGASWVPLYKSFTLRYSGTLRSEPAGVSGTAEGKVDIRVAGFCVARTAERLAEQAAIAALAKALRNQLAD